MSSFVHLRTHSTYSIQQGLAQPKQITGWAADNNSPAIALTDQNNLHAAIKFSQAGDADKVKPILGLDLHICDKADGLRYEICLLAKDMGGYQNLSLISTELLTKEQSSARRPINSPVLERDFLAAHSEGLLVLSGAGKGDVGHHLLQGDKDEARRHLDWWLNLCGDNYYLELQRLGLPNEEMLIKRTLELARSHNVAPLATNNVVFINAADFETHRIRVNVHRGEIVGQERETHGFAKTQYMRTPAEMAELFADIPEAIQNTHYAAQRCNFIFERKLNMPNYKFSEDEDNKSVLARSSAEGLTKLVGADWQEQRGGEYKKRLDMELGIIDEMNYNDYFLIVSDFVNWAKSQEIPVGPGRGSGGGSLVAYATGITALDPLEHNLLFERFLNKGRGSMPDFDIDVCMARRDEVIKYLQDTFGKENAVQIVSFGTMAAKGAVRDVTRVLGKPYFLGDKISSMIPMMVPSLEKAREQDENLRRFVEEDAEAALIFETACKVEGQVRHTGLHAAGLVIAPGPVKDYCPLFTDGDGKIICQYDKDDLEMVGLVKFDVLGLRNLTVIDDTLKHVRQLDGEEIDISKVPFDDPATMKSIAAGKTYAVFQLESSGMRDVARRMVPKHFEDIVALIALYRPGPMELIDDFISNKQKAEQGKPILYPDPALEEILKPTYGIAVYQEQVMQMAQEIAGFTLQQADILRDAMGKKKKEMMRKQEEYFVKGAEVKGYQPGKAKELFGIIEKFAGYGFNRAHSVGYGLLAYWTAYLKVHYPSHYFAANLASEQGESRRLSPLIEECRSMKLAVRPPDVNRSQSSFSLTKEVGVAGENGGNGGTAGANGENGGTAGENGENGEMAGENGENGGTAKPAKYIIEYGLGAIKNVGRGLAAEIVATREQGGPYKSFLDFCSRINPNFLNTGALESLVRAGVFSELDDNYAQLFNSIEQGVQLSKKTFQEKSSGLGDMFGESLSKSFVTKNGGASRWSKAKIAREESKALGFYLRYDPFDLYKDELRRYVPQTIRGLRERQDVTICGRIYALRASFVKSKKIFRWTLIDETGQVQVSCFGENLSGKGNDRGSGRGKEGLLANENVIAIGGRLVKLEGRNGAAGNLVFQVSRVYDVGDLRARYCKQIVISADKDSIHEQTLHKLEEATNDYRDKNGLGISLRLRDATNKREFTIDIMEHNKVLPSNTFLESLEAIIPEAKINLNVK